MGIYCCCSGGGGGPPLIFGCFACGIPQTLTLTWYWCGYNQNPCTTGLTGVAAVWGPRMDILNYDVVTGHWISAWIQTPCTATSMPLVGFPPFGCLYNRFNWNCASGIMTIDFASNSSGANLNSCGSGIHQLSISENVAGRMCPFFTDFLPYPLTPGSSCTTSIFAGGALSP